MSDTNEPRKTSQARIDANRRNAQQSTGPRTPEGKAASSRNRLVHGLRANTHILLDEDPEDFLLVLHDHLDRFKPEGPTEEDLVLRIANAQYRLRRALGMEAGIYRDRLRDMQIKDQRRQSEYEFKRKWAVEEEKPEPPAPIPPDDRDLLARAFNVDCEGPNSFTKLSRYEVALERSIDRHLKQLKLYQAARTKPPKPAPREDPTPIAPTENENFHSNPTDSPAEAPNPVSPNLQARLLFLIAAILTLIQSRAKRANQKTRHPAPRTQHPLLHPHHPTPITHHL